MNKTIPTAKLLDTEAEKLKKRRGAGIRAIDQGTSYDVTGKIRQKVREIEHGTWGRVTDAILLIRYIDPELGVCSHGFNIGPGTIDTLYYLTSRHLNKLQRGE
jgi:hypothetical protein